MIKASLRATTRASLLLCVALLGGCAHVVVPHASVGAAETQSTGKNPVVVAVPPVPSGDSEIVIHENGHDIRTPNIWLGALFVALLFLAK